MDELLEDGLVERVENPRHRRSWLIRITPAGRRVLRRMEHRERKLLSQVDVGIPESDLRAAAGVMRAVRELFESERWERVVKGSRASRSGW